MGPLLPIGLILGGMHLLQQRQEKREVSAQPRYSTAAVSAVTGMTPEGVRVFRVLPPDSFFTACSLEAVDIEGAGVPEGVSIFKLVSLAFGALSAQTAIKSAGSAGYLVLASLSTVLAPADAGVDQLIVMGPPEHTLRLANERGIFGVLAFPAEQVKTVPEAKTEPAPAPLSEPEPVKAEVLPEKPNGVKRVEEPIGPRWMAPEVTES